jgi:hypothetical protein
MPAASSATRVAVSASGGLATAALGVAVPGIGVTLAHSASNSAISASSMGDRWMTNVVSIERELTAAGISASWSSEMISLIGSSGRVRACSPAAELGPVAPAPVMPEANPSGDSVFPLRTGAPVELAADPVHHLALVLYGLPPVLPKLRAVPADSNAMSVIDVVDTSSGDIVKTIEDFSASSVYGYPFPANDGIQLDPATPTGYMFAPGDDQVQQFSY